MSGELNCDTVSLLTRDDSDPDMRRKRNCPKEIRVHAVAHFTAYRVLFICPRRLVA